MEKQFQLDVFRVDNPLLATAKFLNFAVFNSLVPSMTPLPTFSDKLLPFMKQPWNSNVQQITLRI